MLPFVDAHVVHVEASEARALDAATWLARSLTARPAPRPFVALWRLEPEAGFAITESSRSGLTLSGRHRFARYELVLEVTPEAGGSSVRAVTRAEFPQLPGRVYRSLVIGSGGHGVLVRRMLQTIRRRAEG